MMPSRLCGSRLPVVRARGCGHLSSLLAGLLFLAALLGGGPMASAQSTLRYLWSTGDTTASIDVSPTVTTTYYVEISNGISSCLDSLTVFVAPADSLWFLADCPSDTALIGPAAISWSDPVVAGDCPPSVSILQLSGPPSGSVFPLGSTEVTYVASDANGRTDTCSFHVTVFPACPAPENLQALPSSNQVLLTWDNNVLYNGMQIQGRPLGAPFFASLLTGMGSFTVSGLLPSTSYEWKLRARCIDSSLSGFSLLDTFSTTAARLQEAAPALQLFPNPAQTALVLQWDGLRAPFSLEIWDLDGRLLRKEEGLTGADFLLHVEGWPSGTYQARIIGGPQVLSGQFFVE